MRPPSLQEVQRHLSTEPPPPAPSAPTAAFTGSPLSGTAPLTVTFDGTASTGPVDLWEWDVGDGAGYEVGTSTRTVTYTINPRNRKVIVFTAFADTAQYLYGNNPVNA